MPAPSPDAGSDTKRTCVSSIPSPFGESTPRRRRSVDAVVDDAGHRLIAQLPPGPERPVQERAVECERGRRAGVEGRGRHGTGARAPARARSSSSRRCSRAGGRRRRPGRRGRPRAGRRPCAGSGAGAARARSPRSRGTPGLPLRTISAGPPPIASTIPLHFGLRGISRIAIRGSRSAPRAGELLRGHGRAGTGAPRRSAGRHRAAFAATAGSPGRRGRRLGVAGGNDGRSGPRRDILSTGSVRGPGCGRVERDAVCGRQVVDPAGTAGAAQYLAGVPNSSTRWTWSVPWPSMPMLDRPSGVCSSRPFRSGSPRPPSRERSPLTPTVGRGRREALLDLGQPLGAEDRLVREHRAERPEAAGLRRDQRWITTGPCGVNCTCFA